MRLGLFTAPLVMAVTVGPAAAERVPQFNVKPACQAAAERVRSQSGYLSACVQDEMRARDKIKTSWGQFQPAERTHCVQLSSFGGKPTYTELLTCLEMARDARQLRKSEPATVGQALKK